MFKFLDTFYQVYHSIIWALVRKNEQHIQDSMEILLDSGFGRSVASHTKISKVKNY